LIPTWICGRPMRDWATSVAEMKSLRSRELPVMIRQLHGVQCLVFAHGHWFAGDSFSEALAIARHSPLLVDATPSLIHALRPL
jgi:hypothetical protein